MDRAIITEVLGINEIIIHIYGLVMLTKEYCMDRMSQVVVTHRARAGKAGILPAVAEKSDRRSMLAFRYLNTTSCGCFHSKTFISSSNAGECVRVKTDQ